MNDLFFNRVENFKQIKYLRFSTGTWKLGYHPHDQNIISFKISFSVADIVETDKWCFEYFDWQLAKYLPTNENVHAICMRFYTVMNYSSFIE